MFSSMLISKMDNFIRDYLLSELINRKLNGKNESGICDKNTFYSMCKRPAFNNMIVCANDECMTEKFHYATVNLKRKPRQKW